MPFEDEQRRIRRGEGFRAVSGGRAGSSVGLGRELGGAQVVDVAMCAKSREGPSEVAERIDAEIATGRDDAEQGGSSMSTLGAAGEEAGPA